MWRITKSPLVKVLMSHASYAWNFPDIQSWVSPVHCVPKKGGITVVMNEENELIPTRLVTGWRGDIEYSVSSMVSRLFQIPIDPVFKKGLLLLALRKRLLPSSCLSAYVAPGTFPTMYVAIFMTGGEDDGSLLDDFSGLWEFFPKLPLTFRTNVQGVKTPT
ncbi:hypothetical protein Tco_1393235 [Tanacetum coccineum]